MKKHLIPFVCTLFLSLNPFAVDLPVVNALLVEYGLNAQDDGLLTLDTDTGLEWLDLTATQNHSFNSVIAGYGNYTTTYGFRVATEAEVGTLFSNVECPNEWTNNAANIPGASSLLLFLGALDEQIYGPPRTAYQSHGMWGPGPFGPQVATISLEYEYETPIRGRCYLHNGGTNYTSAFDYRGVFLVRNASSHFDPASAQPTQLTPPSIAYEPPIGDITDDGDVDLEDSIVALQVLVGISPSTTVDLSGDVNGDDKIGLEEVVYALQKVAELRNDPPELNPIGNKTIDEDSTLSFSISAFDPDGDTMIYSASGVPDGANFDQSTRTFVWTPAYSQSGNYNVTFTVMDSKGDSDSETISITVMDKTPVFVAPEYFPLNVGDWWEREDDATGEVYHYAITGNKSINGVTTNVYSDPDGPKRYFTSDSGGVKYYGAYLISEYFTGDIIFDTPILYMRNNAEIGTTQLSSTSYSFTVFIPDYGHFTFHVDVTCTTTILGLADITTKNLTLKDCIETSVQVTQVIRETGDRILDDDRYWFHKGVGVVKHASDQVNSTIVESYVNGETRTY